MTEFENVRAELANLQGQIEGALAVLKWGLGVLGGAMMALIAYVFVRMEKVVETLRARSHEQANQIGGVTNRVVKLETWRELREKAAK